MNRIVEINQVCQSFRSGFWMRRSQVLRNVSFSVPEKSVFGFLGANGAGKTTLIHLMTGLRRPTSGTVLIGGCPADTIEAKSKIGYLPERPYFYSHLTGEGLLDYFGALAGMSPSRIKARIPAVLSVVGLSEARKVELKKYSKGMLQRIGIAQALIHDPEFLILDEPMSGLDPLGRKDIRELMVRLSGEGKTVFFSSHIISDVEAICDQVALLQKGELVGCGPIGEFLARGPVRTEIAFKADPKSETDWMHWKEFESVRPMADGIRAVVRSQDQVNQALNKLLKQKVQVLWVNPIRPSLEELFSGRPAGQAE